MTKRRHISLAVKLSACLDALGLLGQEIEWEHTVPLGLRIFDPATGKYDPDEMDPRYLRPMGKADHSVKTRGTSVPLSGDVSKISKLKRVERNEADFRARLLAKDAGEPPPIKKGKAWPKRAFGSRPKRPARPRA